MVEKKTRRSVVASLGGIGTAGLFTRSVTAATTEKTRTVPTGDTVPVSKIVEHEPVNQGVRPSDVPDSRPLVDLPETTAVPDGNVHTWAADAYDSIPGSITRMHCSWTIPPLPRNTNGQTAFYFPALQTCYSCGGNDTIVQSVLQWNWGALSGWSISSWWGPDDSGTYHHSTPKKAYAGDSLYGLMGEMSDGSWYIEVINESRDEITDIMTPQLSRSFTHPYTTLEMANWSYDHCSELPGAATFTDIYVGTIDSQYVVDWTAEYANGNPCGIDVRSPSMSEVTINPY